MYVLESPIQGEHLTIEKEAENQYTVSHENGESICSFGLVEYPDTKNKHIVYSFFTVNSVYKNYIIEHATKIATGKISYS